MKKIVKSLFVVMILFASLLVVTGCGKDEGGAKKTITVDGKKGKMEIAYSKDDFEYDGKKFLTNSNENYNVRFNFGKNTVAKQEKVKVKDAANKSYSVLDVKYNDYEGYAVINKNQAIVQVVLYVDKENDVVFLLKATPVDADKAKSEISKGTSADNLIYNLDSFQQILKDLKYTK